MTGRQYGLQTRATRLADDAAMYAHAQADALAAAYEYLTGATGPGCAMLNTDRNGEPRECRPSDSRRGQMCDPCRVTETIRKALRS